jgi:hypothetical protein
MAIVAVPLLGQFGLSRDVAPAELPPNAWSRGYNARFYNGAVQSMHGDQVLVPVTEQQPTYTIPTQRALAASAA